MRYTLTLCNQEPILSFESRYIRWHFVRLQQDLTRLDNVQEENLAKGVLEENQVSVEVSVKRNQT